MLFWDEIFSSLSLTSSRSCRGRWPCRQSCPLPSRSSAPSPCWLSWWWQRCQGRPSQTFSFLFGFLSLWKSDGRWRGSRCRCFYRWQAWGLGQYFRPKIRILMTMRCRIWACMGKPPLGYAPSTHIEDWWKTAQKAHMSACPEILGINYYIARCNAVQWLIIIIDYLSSFYHMINPKRGKWEYMSINYLAENLV